MRGERNWADAIGTRLQKEVERRRKEDLRVGIGVWVAGRRDVTADKRTIPVGVIKQERL